MTDGDVTPATPAVPPAAPPLPTAGFWRRVAAALVDALLLALLGFLVGMAIGDLLAQMGGYARVVGFAIAMAYGLMNSRLTGGRTPGKRLLGLRVGDLMGRPASIARTLGRQTVYCVPVFLNGAPIDMAVLDSPLGALLSLIIFGGILGIVYLFVFNRKTRRSLHDLVSGTCVYRDVPNAAAPVVPPVWRGHLVVVGLFCLLGASAPYIGKRLAQTATFAGLIPVYQALERQPGVLTANFNVSVQLGEGPEQGGYASATLVLDNPKVNDEERARETARLVLDLYPEARKKQVIVVQFIYGYDMVIASSHRSQVYRFAPDSLE